MNKALLYLIVFISIIISSKAQNTITWDASTDIAMSMYSNMHPRVTLDRAGNPLVVWGRMSDQSVFFSRWDGTAFSSPTKLNPSWLTVATASWMGPDIASHGDTVYVVVKRTPEATDTNRLFIFTSFNGGISFNSPVELGIIADSISRFPAVTTDETGNPIVAFMKFNSTFGDSRWVISSSTDYGSTFSTDVKASGWGNSAEVCDCCPGAIIMAGDTCAMLYRDNNSNIRDCWAGISTDHAASFGSGFALENNNWMINSCPSTGPDGVIVGDSLYSVFMNGASGNYRNYFSISSLSTGTVGTVSNLTGPITGLSQQNYPRIAVNGNAMAIVWKQTVSGSAQLPILFTNNIANGFPSVYDTVDLADVTNADVAISKDKVYVVWEDDNSGTVKYRSGSYTQINTGVYNTESKNFSIYPNPLTSELSIDFPDEDLYTVNIFNSIGEKIYEEKAFRRQSIVTSSFQNGIYLIRVISKNRSYSQKIIKS